MASLSPSDVQREARHHFELYHVLRNRIGDDDIWGVGDYTLDRVEPEKSTKTGFADLVLYDGIDPWLVVECKKLVKGEAIEEIDPYSSTVIEQAERYADDLDAPYIATFNGETLVLLRAEEGDKSLYSRRKIGYSLSDFDSEEDLIFTVLSDMFAIHEGEIERWDEEFDALVSRLRELHEFITPRLREQFESQLMDDDEFASQFVDWADEQGMNYDANWIGKDDNDLTRYKRKKREEAHDTFVKQDAYLTLNQLIFYKIVEDSNRFEVYTRQATYNSVDTEDKILAIESLSVDELDFLQDYLRTRFDTIVEDVDYEAVFEQDPIFGQINFTERISDTLNDFISELSDYNLSNIGTDFLGQLYERLIPTEERKALGEFYTPPKIARLIVEASMESPEDMVLDPAIGTGTFPVEVYRWINRRDDLSHQNIVDQIAGVDINKFAAHLAVINLARQDLSEKTEQTNIYINDFFQIEPDQHLLTSEKATLNENGREGNEFDRSIREVSDVDVVVGNPPYINRNQIPDKELKRAHLPAKYNRSSSDCYMSKKSDIYQYFFTKSLEWLDDGGRLGFITSYKWTTIDSGLGLMQYFLNNTKIKGVIGFNKSIFEDAMVNTYVTLLEKCGEHKDANEAKRNENTVPFVRIERQMPTSEIIDLLDADVSHEGDGYRVILRRQAELRDVEKWNRFIVSPTQYFEIVEHDKITTIPEVCDLEAATGTKTQADDFFKITPEKKDQWEIPDKYLTYALMSKRQIEEDEFLFAENDTNKAFLDLHDITVEIIEQVQDSPIVEEGKVVRPHNIEDTIERRLKERFRNEGNDKLAEYIDHAKENIVNVDDPHGNIYNRGETWWDLGELRRPRLLMTETRQHRPGVIWNVDNLPVKDVVRPFYPKNGGDEKVLAAVLNSSLGRISVESHGRISGGRAIRMMVYDVETLPVIDPTEMTDEERERIEDAFDDWIENPGTDEADEELDRAALDVLGMEDRWKEIQDVAERMTDIRTQSREVELLVGTEEEEEIIDISGVVSDAASVNSKLGDFS